MKYYVYKWINPKTDEIFYVGKGKYTRFYNRAASKHHSGRCQNKKNKLHKEGFTDDDIIHIIKEFNTEVEALDCETNLINEIGIIEEGGTLFNFRKNGTETGSYQKYREKDIQDMAAAYKSGMTLLEIGRDYNIHEATVRRYIIGAGTVTRERGTPRRVDIDHIIRDFKGGMSRSAIARKYGYTSASNITHILKQNNIKFKSRSVLSQEKIDNNKDFIISEYKNGSTLHNIGRAIGVDPMRVGGFVQKNNITRF